MGGARIMKLRNLILKMTSKNTVLHHCASCVLLKPFSWYWICIHIIQSKMYPMIQSIILTPTPDLKDNLRARILPTPCIVHFLLFLMVFKFFYLNRISIIKVFQTKCFYGQINNRLEKKSTIFNCWFCYIHVPVSISQAWQVNFLN